MRLFCPSFTYVATAEVISLLGLTPVMTDVDPDTFNITADIIRPHITSKTKAIVPVHLYRAILGYGRYYGFSQGVWFVCD